MISKSSGVNTAVLAGTRMSACRRRFEYIETTISVPRCLIRKPNMIWARLSREYRNPVSKLNNA
jgi:hypothetical protein